MPDGVVAALALDQFIAGSRGAMAAGSLKVARLILGVTGKLVSLMAF